MILFYKAKWIDFYARPAHNTFFAAQASHAVTIMEDLAVICAASWVELKEEGLILTVSSPAYQQPATTGPSVETFAMLEMESAISSSKHKLKLHCVLPAYVSLQTKKTTTDPFRNVGLLLTAEGVNYQEFIKATYHWKRKTNNRY